MLINYSMQGIPHKKRIIWPKTSDKSSSYQQNFKCKRNRNYFHRDDLLKQKQHAGRPLRCMAWIQKLAMCRYRSWSLVLTESHTFWILLLCPIMMMNPVLDPISWIYQNPICSPASSLNLIEIRLFSLLMFMVTQWKT